MFPKKDDPVVLLTEAIMTGGAPGMIERSEARGQQEMVNGEVLPKKINSGTKEQFEKMGIVFGADADDIFVFVTLPAGWKKEATDHSMWSKLLDDQGRERASIFYKAAFYDRSAHMNISRRYSVSTFQSTDASGTPVEHDAATNFSTYILDCGTPFHLIAVRSKEYASADGDRHQKEAQEWMKENYPDHEDPMAYW